MAFGLVFHFASDTSQVLQRIIVTWVSNCLLGAREVSPHGV
jgi:hypothetical protein